MTRIKTITAKFVDAIPSTIEDGVIYVSAEYGTAVHKCCCGCGQEIVTPLGPTDWRVTLDGAAVSVYPSIGNWSFPCKSHYWINHGRIQWAERWSEEQIRYGRMRDHMAKQRQYGDLPDDRRPSPGNPKPGFWAWLWQFITGQK